VGSSKKGDISLLMAEIMQNSEFPQGEPPKQVLVAMSGGVDSSVAAYLLQKQGYEVIGITFSLYDYSRLNRKEGKGGCCSIEDVDDARLVANHLGIRHYLVNSQDYFRKKVIDYFVDSYRAGKTPNPCIACNTFVKFDELLYHAQLLDIPYIATGHYARVRHSKDSEAEIFRAEDDQKDQSYFLVGVDPEKLKRILFPCGDYSKEEIRDLAKEAGLVTSSKKESMEICFIPNNDYKSFLKTEKSVTDRPGQIVNESGDVVGFHSGIHQFTVGQRKGLGALGLKAHYVVRIDALKNEVIVGDSRRLFSEAMLFEAVHFRDPQKYLGRSLKVKLRSRAPLVDAQIIEVSPDNQQVLVKFDEAQKAVTPGQFAVFYQDKKLVGGGPIVKSIVEIDCENFSGKDREGEREARREEEASRKVGS